MEVAVPLGVVTTTEIGPVIVSLGTCKSICVGLT